tara:strand:+ start:2440 stop:3246 length:807 start_codon:yes stop_codon:yes gene_type:complete
MEESITVIIQGPASDLSIKSLKRYSEEYHVVMSTWAEDSYIMDELKELADKTPNIKLVVNPSPCISGKVNMLPDTTFYYAIAGMDYALEHVETEYAIRTRTDELFEDFQPMIAYTLGSTENQEKFVCGNIFVRKFSEVPYHIGDHVYIAKTKYLKQAFRTLRKMYDGEMDFHLWASQAAFKEQHPFSLERTPDTSGFCAEQILGHAFLFAKGIQPKEWPSVDIFEDNFYVINLSNFGDYIVRWGHVDQIWFSDFENMHSVETMADAIQ